MATTCTDYAVRLLQLRDLMRQENLAAYIIPTDDAHQVSPS